METTPSTSSEVSLPKKMPDGLQNNTMSILEHKIKGEDMHDLIHAVELLQKVVDRIATYVNGAD